MNLNKVILIGRLTRDPDLRYTQGGSAVCEIGLAVNREFTAGNGERRKETLFVDVKLWKRQAELVSQYLRKGRSIFVEGRLQLDTWEQDGQKRRKHYVVAENFQFVDDGERREGNGGGGGGRYAESGGDSSWGGSPKEANYGDDYRRDSAPVGPPDDAPPDVSEDEIPF